MTALYGRLFTQHPRHWPIKCNLMHTKCINGVPKTWRMADLAVGTIRVYFPHTNEFVPENCGIINGLVYYPAVY